MNIENFKLYIKQLSNDELYDEFTYYKYKHNLAYRTVEESIRKRNFSYVDLQKVWLKTKDIQSKRYVSIKEFIDLFTRQIKTSLIWIKDYKLRLKLIKDELSLQNNGKTKS